MNKKKTALARLFDYLKVTFLEGLLVILPVTLTVALFAFFFRLLKSWLAPVYSWEPASLQRIPHSEIFLVLLFILIIGAIFRTFFLRSFLHALERVFFRIPLMNPVYSGIKQLVQAFTVPEKLTFKQVVLVEFPRQGVFSIGFLTSEVPQEVSPAQHKKFYNIFIPTTPNPTTGYLILVSEGDYQVVNMTRQEAMSLIISGGIIQPDRFMKKFITDQSMKG
ncbi:MAG: DUF502 domain-containing protein [Candidatus Babeliales bacterium]